MASADTSFEKPARAADPDAAEERTRGYHLEIFFMSFAALLLEVAYTRVISFKLFYYYTYLVIGLALLGIGCGGVLVSVSARLRRKDTDSILRWGFLIGATSVGVGYWIVARLPIDTLAIWDYGSRASVENLGALLVISFALFASFVSVGVMIATLFARRTNQIGRLYFADLLGAGLACAIVVPFLNTIGAPATIMLSGFVLAAAGVWLSARDHSRAVVFGAVIAVLLGAAVIRPSVTPNPLPDERKHLNDQVGVPYDWSAVFRVDAFEVAGDRRLLFHDALLGSNIFAYDGDPASLARFDADPRRLPFDVHGAPPERMLIIGAAGGNEILASMHFDAAHIDAVELNPVTYRLLTEDFADYSGNIATDPRVNYVNGDGRSFLARSDGGYDFIWFPAPDSYSATNAATAGAFVLSESYLYTSEMIQESLEDLRSNGIIAAQFGEINYDKKPNRTSRYVSTARDALEELGVENPAEHIVVITTGVDPPPTALSTILVKKDPFTPDEIERIVAGMGLIPDTKARYAPGNPVAGDPATEIATLPKTELDAWYDANAYDVRAISDDSPFFWHFVDFDDVLANYFEPITRPDTEDAIGERVLVLLLAIATAFAALFLLLPFVAIRKTWRELPKKPRSALYFAALGFGFMFFEIALIQRLILFLGYPTYSLTVTLASILLFTGIGALLSGRYRDRARSVSLLLLAGLAVLAGFYAFVLPALTDALLQWPLWARIAAAFAFLAPLGLCLGAFMPLGLGAVADLTDHDQEYVAWGWAVNGFASVIGAVLTTILAMIFGFQTVLLLAVVVYAIAVLALRGLLSPSREDTAAA